MDLFARNLRVTCALFVGSCCIGSHKARGDTLYGITNDDNLVSVNTGNPAASALVGTLDVSAASLGLFANSGSLYVYDTNSNLIRQINPATAATVSTINIGLAANPSEGDIAFSNGAGYLVSNLQPNGTFTGAGTLYSFNLSPGSATVVSTSEPFLDGLAFSSAGILYGLSQGGESLYTINLATGVATLVGSGTGINDNCGGFPCYGFGGLSFGSSGNLFAALSSFSAPDSNFYTIDPVTGVATAGGSIPFDQVAGLTSLAAIGPPTPEPPTLLLLVVACFFLVLGFARRNRKEKSS